VLFRSLSLKCLVGSSPNRENSKMWTPERGSWCSAAFSRQQYLDESLSTDDEGVPCSRVLMDSSSLSSVASERGVLSPCALSLFDLLSSGGEDAASSSGRTSCPRDSLASSAVSDGSEEEVVGFDNLPGEPWKVSVPLQRSSSPSRVEEVLSAPSGLPAPPFMFTMAPPGLSGERSLVSLGSAAHSTGSCKPCGFFWKAGGCQNGQLCLHCHLCPERAARQRRKARKFEQRAEALQQQVSQEATFSARHGRGSQMHRSSHRLEM
jgi:hypothetical protein